MFSSVQHRIENVLSFFGYGANPFAQQVEVENRCQGLSKEFPAFSMEQPKNNIHNHKVSLFASHQKQPFVSDNREIKTRSSPIWQKVAAMGMSYLLFPSAESVFNQNNLPNTSDFPPLVSNIGFAALSTSLYVSESRTLSFMFTAGLSTLPTMVHGQFTQTNFLETLGGMDSDRGNAVTTTPAGDIIVTGFSNSFGTGRNDALLAKLSSDGNLLWAKTFGGDSSDVGNAISVTSEGDIIITGYTSSFGAGNNDVLLAKFSSDGTFLWSNTLGGSSDDRSDALTITSEGEIVVIGETSSFGVGGDDVLLAKFTTDGAFLWANTLGGASDDRSGALITTPEGDLIVAGYTDSVGAGDRDALLAKFSNDGAFLWANTFGGASLDEGRALASTFNGDLIVAGVTSSFGAGENDVLLAKFLSDGVFLWANTLGGSDTDQGSSLMTIPEGDLIVVGRTNSFGAGGNDALLAKFSSDGTILSANTLGGVGNDWGRAIVTASGGNFILIGDTSSFSDGNNDLLLSKLNPQRAIENCLAWQDISLQVESITPIVSDVTVDMTASTSTSWTVQDISSALIVTDITNSLNRTTECYSLINVSQSSWRSPSGITYDQSSTLQNSRTEQPSSSTEPLSSNEIFYGESIEIFVGDQVVGTFTFTGGTGMLNGTNMNILTLNFNDDFNPENGQEIILFTTSENLENLELINNNQCDSGEGYQASGVLTEEEDGNQTYSLTFETESCSLTQAATPLSQWVLSTTVL